MKKKKIVTISNCFATSEVLKKVINSIPDTDGVFMYLNKIFNDYNLNIKKGKSKNVEYTVSNKKIIKRLESEIDKLLNGKHIDLLIIDIDLLDNKILTYCLNKNIDILVSFPIQVDFSIDGMEDIIIRQLDFVDSINVKGKLIGAALSEDKTLKSILQSLE